MECFQRFPSEIRNVSDRCGSGLCTAELFPGIPAAEIMDCTRQLSCGIRCRSGGPAYICGFPCAGLFWQLWRREFSVPCWDICCTGQVFFILCWGVTVFLLLQLLHPASTAALAACLIAGAAAGGFALARERVTVSLVTAIGGGFGSAFLLLSLAGQDSPLLTILLTAILAFLGILVQLKPWKNKDYWEQEDQNLQRGKSGAGQAPQVPEEAETERKKGETKNRRRKRREPETKQPQKTAARRRRNRRLPLPGPGNTLRISKNACVFPAFSGAAARSRFPESSGKFLFGYTASAFQRSLGNL